MPVKIENHWNNKKGSTVLKRYPAKVRTENIYIGGLVLKREDNFLGLFILKNYLTITFEKMLASFNLWNVHIKSAGLWLTITM